MSDDDVKGMASGHRMVVKVKKPGETTSGGIYIPPALQDREFEAVCHGVVLDQGPNCYKGKLADNTGSDTPWCKVGDHIYFKQYHGVVIPIKDSDKKDYKYLFINDADMYGFYRENSEFI